MKNLLRHSLFVLLLAANALHCVAQHPIEIALNYPFINYEANHLHYDSSSPQLMYFFHKWHHIADAMQGNLNIVHIGSSHVQAGTFPNRVRYNIMSEYPDLIADRGMIFPYSAAARCNNPIDYTIHCPEPVELTRCVYASPMVPMGCCGITITAHDQPTHIQVALRRTHIDYATQQVIVIGRSLGDLVPLLNINQREVPPSYIDPESRRYVFNLSEQTDSFEVVFPCQEGQSFDIMGIYLGNRQPGFSYHSLGVNGASLVDYMKCDYMEDDLRLLHPDLVIFGIGINDASGPNFLPEVFYNRYMAIIDRVRNVNPDCAFLFITNNDSFKRTGKRRKSRYVNNANGAVAREVFYRLARAVNGAVWDQYEVMGGAGSMEKWYRAGLAQRDHVHFTNEGYTMLGDMLYNALVEAVHKNKNTFKRSTIRPRTEKTKPTPKQNKQPQPATSSPKTKPKKDTVNNDEPFRYISY